MTKTQNPAVCNCGWPQIEHIKHYSSLRALLSIFRLMTGCLRKLPRGLKDGPAGTCPRDGPAPTLRVVLQRGRCRSLQMPAGGRPGPPAWPDRLLSVSSVSSSWAPGSAFTGCRAPALGSLSLSGAAAYFSAESLSAIVNIRVSLYYHR